VTTTDTAGDVQSFRQLAYMAHAVAGMNVQGVTQAESLVQPQPAGNCFNWVLGHLVAIYNNALPLVGQQPVMDRAELAVYDRGAPPLTDPAQALEVERLLALWDETCARFQAGLGTLTPEVLDAPAPFSPTGNPDETVRSLVATILFHQAYHAGQLGVLRRISGHDGAVK
jgi:hypothetical protein